MCLQHLFPNMQKWSHRETVIVSFCSCGSDSHLLPPGAVAGFCTRVFHCVGVGHSDWTSTQSWTKTCSFIWAFFKTWIQPKFRKTSRNKTSASAESSAARIELNWTNISALFWRSCLCSVCRSTFLYLYFNLMKTYKWLCDCSSGVTARCCPVEVDFWTCLSCSEDLWQPTGFCTGL